MNEPKIIDNFLTSSQCNYLVSSAMKTIQDSTVVDPKTGKMVKHSGRTSSNAYLDSSNDKYIQEVERLFSELAGIPAENGEWIQVINYKIGQEYKPHFDTFDEDKTEILKQGGNRTFTVLAYLSDVEEGGETVFPDLNITVKPERGRVVLFKSEWLHGSNPVIKGEKWACNKWFRERKYI